MTDVIRVAKPAMLNSMAAARHFAVEASAGTGKTYLIERRIADLIIRGAATIDEILVVTFTEKATTELRRRVRSFLLELAHTDSSNAEKDEPHWAIDADVRKRLQAAVRDSDRATISTLHGFCSKLLKESAFDGGRLFSQTQVPDELAFSRSFFSALRRRFAVDTDLQPYLAAWLDQGGDVARLRQLLFRCAQLHGDVHPPFLPEKLLTAVANLRQVLVEAPEDQWAQLFCDELPKNKQKAVLRRLSALIPALAAEAPAELLGALDSIDLAYLTKTLPGGALRRATEELSSALVPLASAVVERFLPVIKECLAKDKAREGTFDFMDMLAQTWGTLSGPHGAALARRLRAKYRFALIDEFQDTDELQWNIFEYLFLCDETSLTVVGDPKQAIYGFRGADLPIYLRAVEQIVAAGGKRLSLDTNYRSSPAMVEAFNTMFEAGGDFFRGTIEYSPVRAGTDKRLEGRDGQEQPALCYLRATEEKQSAAALRGDMRRAMANEIERILGHGPGKLFLKTDDTRRPLRAGDIFVLTRSGREAEDIARDLRQRRIPCALFQQEGLFQTEQARQVRDLLSAVAEPDNPAVRLRVWQTDFFGLELRQLLRTGSIPDTHPLAGLLYEWHRIAARLEYETLFATILRDSQIVERLLIRDGNERALENYRHLFELLLEDASATRPEPTELVARLAGWIEDTEGWDSAERNVQRVESHVDAVQVMTMHKAKGLEAACVFVYGGWTKPGGGVAQTQIIHEGDERLLLVGGIREATHRERADGESAAEDRRLMYVTATRAIGRLYLPDMRGTKTSVRGAYEGLHESLTRCEAMATSIDLDPPATSTILAAVTSWPAAPLPLGERPAPLPEWRRHRVTGSYSGLSSSAPKTDSAAPIANEGLPGGRETGIFLHALLEHLPLASVRETPVLEDWSRRPDISGLVDEQMRSFSVDPAHRDEVFRLLYQALSCPLDAGETVLPSLAHADRVAREVEFLYRVGTAPRHAYMKGFIDVVCQYEGATYLVDWKSDQLPDFAAATIQEHVDGHYRLQATTYGLAMKRAQPDLDYRGMFFVFLRGSIASFVPFTTETMEIGERTLREQLEVLG